MDNQIPPDFLNEAAALMSRHDMLSSRLAETSDTLRPAVETALNNIRTQAAELLGTVASNEALFELEIRLEEETKFIDELHKIGGLTDEQAEEHKALLLEQEVFAPIKLQNALSTIAVRGAVEVEYVSSPGGETPPAVTQVESTPIEVTVTPKPVETERVVPTQDTEALSTGIDSAESVIPAAEATEEPLSSTNPEDATENEAPNDPQVVRAVGRRTVADLIREHAGYVLDGPDTEDADELALQAGAPAPLFTLGPRIDFKTEADEDSDAETTASTEGETVSVDESTHTDSVEHIEPRQNELIDNRYHVEIVFDDAGNLVIGNRAWPLEATTYEGQNDYSEARKRALELLVSAPDATVTTAFLKDQLIAEGLFEGGSGQRISNLYSSLRTWFSGIQPAEGIGLVMHNGKRGPTAAYHINPLYRATLFSDRLAADHELQANVVHDENPTIDTELASAEGLETAETAEESLEKQRTNALKLIVFMDMYRDLLKSFEIPEPDAELIDRLIQYLPSDDRAINGEALTKESVVRDRKESARLFREIFNDEQLFNDFVESIEPEDPLTEACDYLMGLGEHQWAVINGLLDSNVEVVTTFGRSSNRSEEIRTIKFIVTTPDGKVFERTVTSSDNRYTRLQGAAETSAEPVALPEDISIEIARPDTHSSATEETSLGNDEVHEPTADLETDQEPMTRAERRRRNARAGKSANGRITIGPVAETSEVRELPWQREITIATGNVLETLERLGVLASKDNILVSKLKALTVQEMPRLTDKTAFERLQRAGLASLPSSDKVRSMELSIAQVIALDLLKSAPIYNRFTNRKQREIAERTVQACIDKYFAKREQKAAEESGKNPESNL